MLHFGKNPEKILLNLAKIQQNSGKIKFAKFWKKQQNIQQKVQHFSTKILRLESGAKECIV